MATTLKFETFSTAPPPIEIGVPAGDVEALLAKARGAARAQGFEEGAAATAAAFDSDRKLVLERIAEAVEDAQFNAEEARRTASAALGPIVDALARGVAPHLARAGLGREIAALVVEATQSCGAATIVVSVAPEMTDAATDAVASTGIAVEIKADFNLDPLRARVAWSGGHDQIDLAACIESAKTAISAFFGEVERTGTNG